MAFSRKIPGSRVGVADDAVERTEVDECLEEDEVDEEEEEEEEDNDDDDDGAEEDEEEE